MEAFGHLYGHIETFHGHKSEILKRWMASPPVGDILREHGFTTEFFAQHFGMKVIEYALGNIEGSRRPGECPVISVMVIMFQKRGIPLPDIFMICAQLKNTLLHYALDEKMLTPEVLKEICTLMDCNFAGVIRDYIARKYGDTAAAPGTGTPPVEAAAPLPAAGRESVPEITVSAASEADPKRTTSAAEYMGEVDIDMEMIDELIELEHEALGHLEREEELNEATKEGVVSLFEQYSRILNMMIEFNELAYTLNLLKNLLNETDPEQLDNMNKTAILSYITAIINDLNHWRTTVFIDQSADDIHYLDKTLLSSIAQLEIMLRPPEEEEDAIEFF
jgi:hypothetical protein